MADDYARDQRKNEKMKKSKYLTWLGVVVGAAAIIFFWVIPMQAEKTVLISMQETLDNSPDFRRYDLQVQNVHLIRKGMSEFGGLASISYQGESYDVSITALASWDGSVIWEAGPGSFMFLIQKDLEDIGKLFD